MKLRHYWNLLIGKNNFENPATLTLANVKAVLQSYKRKKQIASFNIENHIYEQIIWRRTQVMIKSPICWEGQCKVCGCDILGKTMEDRECSSKIPCYPPMMTQEQWDNYKKLNNIKLFN